MSKRMFLLTTGALVTISVALAYRRWRERAKKNKKGFNCKLTPDDIDKLVESTIEGLKQLQGPSSVNGFQRIYFRKEDELRQKLRKMFSDGLPLLQIISDFDRTLSKARHMGKPVPSTHGIMERYPELTEESKSKFSELRSTYLPIEFDPQLTEEEKVPYMQEWWSQAHAELLRVGVQRNRLTATVADSGISLRDGAPDFLRTTHRLQVPLLIFSAGIGNVIEEVIEQQNCCFKNIQVAANYMTFDHQGDLNGFQGQLIHTYNKSAGSCADTDFCAANTKRRNVLLLGDSTGDRRMADGAVKPSHEANVIRVGFLNDKVADSLKLYLEHYDIVLVDDPTFEIPNFLLKSLSVSGPEAGV